MPNNYKNWEVWLANVKFEDSNVVKRRPVLIIGKQQLIGIALKMTSKPPRSNYPGEYQVNDCLNAGLNKNTTVRCSKVLRLTDRDLVRKIGRLSTVDIINIQTILAEMQRS